MCHLFPDDHLECRGRGGAAIGGSDEVPGSEESRPGAPWVPRRGGDLRGRALRGGTWTALGFGAGQLLRLASTLVLARHLLGPEAFGVAALVSVLVTGLEMLSDVGLGVAVVHHERGDDPLFLDTAFWLQAVRGAALWAVAVAVAWPFAAFYDDPALAPLAVAVGAGPFLRGFSSPAVWTLTRKVELRGVTILNVGSEVAGFGVSVAWALADPSPWAIAAGYLGTSLVLGAGSHLLPGERPRLRWDRAAAWGLLVFGTGVFLSTATYFLAGQGERLFLGKYVTTAELGCFSLAFTLANAPARGLAQLATQVVYPVVSEVFREDRARGVRLYLRTRTGFLAASASMSVFFALLGPWIVASVLPEKYASAKWMIPLLGVRAAHDVFVSPQTAVLFARGASRWAAYANALRLVLLAGGLWAAFRWAGFLEAVWVLTLAPIAATGATLVGIGREVREALRGETLAFLAFVAVSALALVVAAAL